MIRKCKLSELFEPAITGVKRLQTHALRPHGHRHRPIKHYYYYYYYYLCLLSHAFSSWYFSWTSGDPPPLMIQASHCSTFRIMCDVPSIAVFCSESIECFPGIASKFFLEFFRTIPVASIITGIIVHFRLHIRFTSLPKLLYFNFFSASFYTTFLSAGNATSVNVHVFSFLFLSIIYGLFAVTSLSACIDWFRNTATSPSSYTGLGMLIIIIINSELLFDQLTSFLYTKISARHQK